MRMVKVVTGTGSSGTTFFIELLAKVGLTKLTGAYNDSAKGGYEWILHNSGPEKIKQTPAIFKDPRLFFGGFVKAKCDLEQADIGIDFVWVCHRNFAQASASRLKRGVEFVAHGNMRGVGSDSHERQVDFFRKGLESTVSFLCANDISFMLVDYERLGDWEYCAQCIRFAGYELTMPLLGKIEDAHKEIYKSEYKGRYKRL